ncbi:MAG: thioredoxin domain-containing protein [Bacteroidota bacterium]|nr:thioredoxin domain-containing protein [Bacteroidota bacterium]
MTLNKKANNLITETSPYLLQHAYNPVNWMAFSDEAFAKAKQENKLILISIGYSSCHWCHVMEHESFEDAEVAEIMNTYFINVKVDREERTDVDMLYMQAVQLMTGQGGWPLNCFVLPDGKPIYGGTYFQKQQWVGVLKNLSSLYKNEPQKVVEYAQNLTDGIHQAELITTQKTTNSSIDKSVIQKSVENWKKRHDNKEGGPNRAPKFPLPNNYQFLLRYAILQGDNDLLDYVNLTLTKMAQGGIYDQLRGGFSRYSTDTLWKVPHFEKMLYDNAQLVSLYTEAYTLTKNSLYKQTVTDTLNFVEKEWYNPRGYFYSAYDADSDGEEGKYYVWNKSELQNHLAEHYELFADYFNVNDLGYWEHDNYILMRSNNTAELLLKYNLSIEDLQEKINSCKTILNQIASKRVKPGLDDKTLTSWNALMCSAYAKAYLVFDDENYKAVALSSIGFILSQLTQSNGQLHRTYKNKESKIDGFLDDYAFVIEALINCYLISQNEDYVQKANNLCELTLELFKNPNSEFLFYTNSTSLQLIARTTEVSDNVIPASNSQMALNLFYLGTYLNKKEWLVKSQNMLKLVTDGLSNYGAGYSNWGCLALHLNYPFKEVVIVGNNVNTKLKELYKHGILNAIFSLSQSESNFPLVKNRYVANKTLIYVCENNTCQLPTESVNEALKLIEK